MSASHVVQFFPGIRLSDGGVVRAVLDLCSAMAARGNRVTLVTYDAPDVPAAWPVLQNSTPAPTAVGLPDVVLLAVDRPRGLLPRSAVEQFDQLLVSIPNAVVHLHTPWLPANIQLGKVASRRGVPFVVTIHGMLDDWSMTQKRLKKKLFLLLGGRRHLRRAAAIHWTAAAERDQGRRYIGTGGPADAILPCLVDLSEFGEFPSKLGTSIKAFDGFVPKLLFLSRLHQKKGAHDLIDAAAILRDRGVAFSLTIAGPVDPSDPGYESRLRKQVQTLKLDDRVEFVGMVTGPAKISLLYGADVFVLPTRQENFGLVLIEAMAAGCTVVTTRGTDIWRELELGGALVIDPDPAVMAKRLGQLIYDQADLVDRGTMSRAWAMQRFEPGRLAMEYENLYRTSPRPVT